MTKSTVIECLLNVRLAGRVERCHTIPHHGSYSVAAHSWGAAMLLYHLFPDDFQRLVVYVLSHDIPEGWVGDIPSPVLRYNTTVASIIQELEKNLSERMNVPSEHKLSQADKAALKCVDRLEFYLWAREQLAMGNQFVAESLKEIERYIDENPFPYPVSIIYQQLKECDMQPRQAGVIKELSND